VSDLLGPVKGECEGIRDRCANKALCPLYGTLGRVSKDGLRRVRGCGDPVARGKRSRKQGLAKQRLARKALGIGLSGQSNEEHWSDEIFANEVKSGAQVGPAATVWLRIEAQVVANQADFGDRRRPVRAVLMPDGWGTEGLVMVRLSTWEAVVRPALEAQT
jgi:hypothetical protein